MVDPWCRYAVAHGALSDYGSLVIQSTTTTSDPSGARCKLAPLIVDVVVMPVIPHQIDQGMLGHIGCDITGMQ